MDSILSKFGLESVFDVDVNAVEMGLNWDHPHGPSAETTRMPHPSVDRSEERGFLSGAEVEMRTTTSIDEPKQEGDLLKVNEHGEV